jgi:hypothetical protein
MATTATPQAATDTATGSLSTEKVTYRAYIQTETDKDGKTVVSKIKSQAEADKKNKDGVSVNWAKLEEEKDKQGNPAWALLNENEFIRYQVKDLAGFQTLVPEDTQQIYIIQCGLNYIMNAKANAAMTALVEGAPEPTPVFNQNSIDLRIGIGDDGEYSINEAPSRKSLTELDKLIKTLKAMGVADDKLEDVLTALAAAKAASAVGQEEAA